MKVLVIGGGLVGVQTAYYLLLDGHDVSLVEQNSDFALESSFANGGLITPSHAAPWNSPGIFKILLNSVGKKNASIHVNLRAIGQYLGWGRQFVRNSTRKRYYRTIERNFALARYSQHCFHEILDTIPLKFTHAQSGSMMVYTSAANFKETKARFEKLAHHGVKTRICTPGDLVALEPALAYSQNALAGGVYFENDEHGDAHEFTRSLARYIMDNGVSMHTEVQVRGFIRDGQRIAGIKTDNGNFYGDAIVVAAGHWSTEMLATVGVNLPVRPVKGSSLTYNLPGWKEGPRIPVVDDDMHVAVSPLGDKLRIVGTAEFCGYDPIVRPERMDLLRRSGVAILPQLEKQIANIEPELEWSGHRPMTPDCMPVLGKCGFDNMYLNTGHGYLGWTTGAGTSKAVVDLIGGRTPEINMEHYGLGRF